MFHIGIVSHGSCYNPNNLNGMQAMAMQSQVDTDAVIASFEEYINAGFPAAIALAQAFTVNKVSESNLTDFDKERINRKVEALYKNKNNNSWGQR